MHMEKRQAHAMTTKSMIFAFLPIGCPSTASTHTIRIGHCRKRDSADAPNNVCFRFHGLNQIREMMMLVDVDQDKATDAIEEVKDMLRGPGTLDTIKIKSFQTFEQASDLGVSWFRSSLPLADIRACFYEVGKRLKAKFALADHYKTRDRGPGSAQRELPKSTVSGT